MFDESQASPELRSDPTTQDSDQIQPSQQQQQHQQHQHLQEPAAEVLEICSGCQTGIADKYLLRIRSLAWHEHCATCCACNCQLSEGCFVKDNKLYCAHDYARRHGIRCQSCCQPIATQDLAMWAHAYAYHLACFVCAACGAQLRKGDQFAVRPTDGRPVCLCDAASVTAGSGGSSSSVANFCPDERQAATPTGPAAVSAAAAAAASVSDNADFSDPSGRRRARTVLTAAQRRRFRVEFEQNPRPNKRICEALAHEAGLAVRVVQVWFQNQRAQLKKAPHAGGDSPRQLRSRRNLRAPQSAGVSGGGVNGGSGGRQLRLRLRRHPSQEADRHQADDFEEDDENEDFDDEDDEQGDEEDFDEEDLDADEDDAEPVDEDGEATLGNLMIIPALDGSQAF